MGDCMMKSKDSTNGLETTRSSQIGCQEESLEIGKNSEGSWVIEGWGVTIERRWKSDYKKRKLERMAKSNGNSDS